MTAPRRPAIIDVGSNSTRLLLVEGMDPDGARGARTTTITGLRRGAAPDGRLADAALGRLDAALVEIAERIDRFGPDVVVPVGTSAVRDAPDRGRVEDLIRSRLGVGLHVVAGEQEAEFAFRGARAAHPGGRVLVVDIGGGSTELIAGGAQPAAAVSLQRGAVRCTEGFLRDDPPDPAARARLAVSLDEDMASALERVGRAPAVIGVAGTFTTLAAVDIGHYDPALVHDHVLTVDRLRAIVDRLASLPVAERREVPGLEPARAPYIVAGGEIALAALRAAASGEVIVSERDLLDGIAAAVVDGAFPAHGDAVSEPGSFRS